MTVANFPHPPTGASRRLDAALAWANRNRPVVTAMLGQAIFSHWTRNELHGQALGCADGQFIARISEVPGGVMLHIYLSDGRDTAKWDGFVPCGALPEGRIAA